MGPLRAQRCLLSYRELSQIYLNLLEFSVFCKIPDERMDGQMDGQTDGRMDGRTEGKEGARGRGEGWGPRTPKLPGARGMGIRPCRHATLNSYIKI